MNTRWRNFYISAYEHPPTLYDQYEKDSILSMAYVCNQCNFFLIWCDELPRNIQHGINPENSLTLLSRQPNFCYCDEPSDDFTYTCKFCYCNLHPTSASIPSTLRNEIHQHPLILCRKAPYSTRRASCKDDCRNAVYECEMCNLVLAFKCALLPNKVKHDCHMHPLILTSLIEGETDEYYCFACEEKREPNHWVYYCSDYEFSAHRRCMVSELAGGPPKEGPVGFNLRNHLLGLITKNI